MVNRIITLSKKSPESRVRILESARNLNETWKKSGNLFKTNCASQASTWKAENPIGTIRVLLQGLCL